MEYTQRIHAVSPTVLRVGLPLSFRVLFGAFALFMGMIMFVDGSVAPIPGVLFFVALGATFFVDEWYFDSETHAVRRRFGWLFVIRTTTYPVSELAGVRHELGTPRRPRKPVHSVSIETKDGRRLTIDLGSGREREMEDAARLIARHLEIDLLP